MKNIKKRLGVTTLSIIGLSAIIVPSSLSLIACTGHQSDDSHQAETEPTNPEINQPPIKPEVTQDNHIIQSAIPADELATLQTKANDIHTVNEALDFLNPIFTKYYTLEMLKEDLVNASNFSYEYRGSIQDPSDHTIKSGTATIKSGIDAKSIKLNHDNTINFDWSYSTETDYMGDATITSHFHNVPLKVVLVSGRDAVYPKFVFGLTNKIIESRSQPQKNSCYSQTTINVSSPYFEPDLNHVLNIGKFGNYNIHKGQTTFWNQYQVSPNIQQALYTFNDSYYNHPYSKLDHIKKAWISPYDADESNYWVPCLDCNRISISFKNIEPVYPTIGANEINDIHNIVQDGLNDLTAIQTQYSDVINSNQEFKQNLREQIVKKLRVTIPTFNHKSISGIYFDVSEPDSTHHFNVTPTIDFNSNVQLDSEVVSNEFNGVALEPVSFAETDQPRLTQTAANVINKIIQAKLTELSNNNPNNLTNQYLNNPTFIRNLITDTLAQKEFQNSKIPVNNMKINFTVNPIPGKASVSVKYSITVYAHRDGKIVAPEGLNIYDNQFISNPVIYQNNFVTMQMKTMIYKEVENTIHHLIDQYGVKGVTVNNLKTEFQPSITSLNKEFGGASGDVITNITFDINAPNNSVYANVTFGDHYELTTNDLSHVFPNNTHTYQIVLEIYGLPNENTKSKAKVNVC